MKVREFLQIELWSKRTSRKIFVGFGLVVAGLVFLFLFDRCWLTVGERAAGREALKQIDALGNLDSMSYEDFKAREKQAEAKVETAKQAACTTRDKRVAETLYAYVVSIDTERSNVEMRKVFQRRHLPTKDSQRELEEKIDLQGLEGTQLLRAVLHRALD
jgi:hypothetical protein